MRRTGGDPRPRGVAGQSERHTGPVFNRRGGQWTYLAVFLAALARALYVNLTWSGPDAHVAFVIPTAVASPSAGVLVAVSAVAADTSPTLEVLASTPVLLTVVCTSALVQTAVPEHGQRISARRR